MLPTYTVLRHFFFFFLPREEIVYISELANNAGGAVTGGRAI
jgi:hypothetical protein